MVRLFAAGGFALLVLSACMAEAQQDTGTTGPPATLNPQTEAACRAAGGTWGPRGLFPEPLCSLPNLDAGKACQTAADCVGVCLAESRTCSPVRPIFGCFALLDDQGREVTMCAD